MTVPYRIQVPGNRKQLPPSDKTVDRVDSELFACASAPKKTISILEIINGLKTTALWDIGSATTLISEDFALSHNFDITEDEDVVLQGPFCEA